MSNTITALSAHTAVSMLLLVCHWEIGHAQATPSIIDDRIIEEIVVTAIDRCGPWPIAHESVVDCTYPELKRGQISELRTLRSKYFDACLSCSETACSQRQLPIGARREKFICRRLFQTPRWVPRSQLRVVDVGYLVTEFSYDISTRGLAENFRITSLDSNLQQEEVLELISRAAAEARFEPIRRQGTRMRLVNLEDSYRLED